MYEEDTVGCNFDPNLNSPLPPPPPPQLLNMPSPSQIYNTNPNNNNFAVEENLRLSMEELSYHHHHHHLNNNNNNNPNLQEIHRSAVEIELQNELGFNPYNPNTANNKNSHLVSFEQQPNWDNNNIHGGVQDQMMQQQQQFPEGSNNTPYPPPTPDLLNLFSLPRCSPSSVLQNSSSLTFTNPHLKTSNFPSSLAFFGDVDTPSGTAASSVLYDPLFHLNLPPQPPLFRELLQSLPHGYSMPGSRTGSLFSSGGDEREGIGGGGVYPDGINNNGMQFENEVLEFSREMGSIGRGGRDAKGTKHFATEKHRRVQLNGKYTALRSLVPNPSKPDRASVVGDAIDYINELKRTVEELKLLVEKKRCGRERRKRAKTEQDGGAGDDESCNMKPLGDPHDQCYNNGSLRSSWLQRKSKETEVDVRIIDDEVTIKLVQRKKINLLLFVSKLLDDLQLDLHHVAGGHIGNSYSFLFNTKMYEGSSLYATAIANKLIEVLDRQYAAVPPTNSFREA